MNNLMSEEHYCYNIHTSLTKSSAYSHFPSIGNHPIRTNPPFLQENIDPTPSMIFH